MLKVSITGVAEASRKMAKNAEAVRDAVKRIVQFGIFQIERDVKMQPVSIMRVKTGRMRASIGGGSFIGGSFPTKNGITLFDTYGTIGPTVEYAAKIHKKYPFMTKGAKIALPSIKDFAAREIKRVVS